MDSYLKYVCGEMLLKYVQDKNADIDTDVIKALSSYISSTKRTRLYNELVKTYAGYAKDYDYSTKKNYLSKREEKFLYKSTASIWGEKHRKHFQEKFLSSVYIGKMKNSPVKKRIDFLQKTFKLSEIEKDLMVFKILSYNTEPFRALEFNGTMLIKMPIFKKCYHNKKAIPHNILFENSKLHKYGIVSDDNHLSSNIGQFVYGFRGDFTHTFYKKYEGKPIPLNQHTQKKASKIIKETIVNNQKGVNILLYGVPGTGKTEFVRSVAANVKKDLYELSNNTNSDESRIMNFWACKNTVPKNSIILIDEADNMLNGGGLFNSKRNIEKNKINEILDSTNSINFWVTNYIGDMDNSTKRRFDYSVGFEEFTNSQRLSVWKSCIAKRKLKTSLTEKDIIMLSTKYKLNAGGIDIVLKNFKNIPKTNRCIDKLIDFITPYQKLMGQVNIDTKTTIVKNYSMNGLNIKGEIPLNEGLSSVKEFSKFMKTNKYKDSDIKNMNMMLYGPSGTGKTEFVKYMAKEIGRELLVKTGSSFLNKYVGETEQNIKRIFAEAQEKKAVLFLDEADGLFFTRENAIRSFETTQVNELLVQMENFQGIFVCSTNFQKSMDSAAFRRFNFKFEFDYLDNSGKEIFYNLYFKKMLNNEITDENKTKLFSIDGLTPGDFKVVQQKNAFAKNEVLHDRLISGLITESKFKTITTTNKIGF